MARAASGRRLECLEGSRNAWNEYGRVIPRSVTHRCRVDNNSPKLADAMGSTSNSSHNSSGLFPKSSNTTCCTASSGDRGAFSSSGRKIEIYAGGRMWSSCEMCWPNLTYTPAFVLSVTSRCWGVNEDSSRQWYEGERREVCVCESLCISIRMDGA
jgi:hypothetical protein